MKESSQEKENEMEANLIKSNSEVEGYKIVATDNNHGVNQDKICILSGNHWVFLPVEPIFRKNNRE